MSIPLELMVEPDTHAWCYRACWCDGEPDSTFLANIPESWLDLIPFMVARKLLEQGNNPDRLLIVRLRGADFDLMRAPLGVVAAPPLLNTAKPVTKPAYCVYRDQRHV
jgi:hypothetical protein